MSRTWNTTAQRLARGMAFISALVLGVLFVVASVLKAAAPIDESAALLRAVGANNGAATALVHAGIFVECGLGALLISGIWQRVLLVVVGLVLICFSILMVVATTKGYSGSCGCFGAAFELGTKAGVARNGVLISLAGLGAWCATNERSGMTRSES